MLIAQSVWEQKFVRLVKTVNIVSIVARKRKELVVLV
jgi:hypothetical protein